MLPYRVRKPLLHCIPVVEPFQCVGMGFKEMDTSTNGNRYALVFQDYLTKWPEDFVAKCLAELVWRHGYGLKSYMIGLLTDVLQDTAEILR